MNFKIKWVFMRYTYSIKTFKKELENISRKYWPNQSRVAALISHRIYLKEKHLKDKLVSKTEWNSLLVV